jgi:hypothetical protein
VGKGLPSYLPLQTSPPSPHIACLTVVPETLPCSPIQALVYDNMSVFPHGEDSLHPPGFSISRPRHYMFHLGKNSGFLSPSTGRYRFPVVSLHLSTSAAYSPATQSGLLSVVPTSNTTSPGCLLEMQKFDLSPDLQNWNVHLNKIPVDLCGC